MDQAEELDRRRDAGRPETQPVDLELAFRLRQGDRDAFTLLYDRHAAAVHGLIRTILRDDQLAEEATHDVFLGLWRQPQAFDPARGSFAGWLLRVARNRAIDILRRRREQPMPTGQNASGDEIDLASWLVDPAPGPAEQAATGIMQQEVRRALAQLTPDQQRLLELAYFKGLTQREIAEQVARPLGTVKTQIRAAMHRLAEILVAADPTLSGNERTRDETAPKPSAAYQTATQHQ